MEDKDKQAADQIISNFYNKKLKDYHGNELFVDDKYIYAYPCGNNSAELVECAVTKLDTINNIAHCTYTRFTYVHKLRVRNPERKLIKII